jgi:hypothetical protein
MTWQRCLQKTDPRWKRILTDPACPEFTGLATKLTVGRLRREVKQQPAVLSKAADELYAFFVGNGFAQKDLHLV